MEKGSHVIILILLEVKPGLQTQMRGFSSFSLPSGSLLSCTVLSGFGGDQGCGPQLRGRQWEAMVAFLVPGVHGGEQDDVTIGIALAARPPLCLSFPRWTQHLQASIEMLTWGRGQGGISLRHGRVLTAWDGQGAGGFHVCWDGARKEGYGAYKVGRGRSKEEGLMGTSGGEDGAGAGGVRKVPIAPLLLQRCSCLQLVL